MIVDSRTLAANPFQFVYIDGYMDYIWMSYVWMMSVCAWRYTSTNKWSDFSLKKFSACTYRQSVVLLSFSKRAKLSCVSVEAEEDLSRKVFFTKPLDFLLARAQRYSVFFF